MTRSPWDDDGDADYADNTRFLAMIDAEDGAGEDDFESPNRAQSEFAHEIRSAEANFVAIPTDINDERDDASDVGELNCEIPNDDKPFEVIAFDDPETFDATHLTPGPRYSRPVVMGFVCTVALATIGLAVAMVGMRSTPHVETLDFDAATPHTIITAAGPASSATTETPPPGADTQIPYQATSPCPPGSTSAQNAASNDPTQAWVCVRGGGDGQVLTLELGAPMKVTAISITPGWIGSDTNGTDQWLAHRVITRVQWILIDGEDRTPVLQDTDNIHGEALQPMPSRGGDQGILASKIEMIVLQTSRPSPDTPVPNAARSGGGMVDTVLGAPLGPALPQTDSGSAGSENPPFPPSPDDLDPVDNTFAVSAIRVLGHSPQ